MFAQQTDVAAAVAPIKVSPVVIAKTKITGDMGRYPADAMAAHVQGPVVMSILIGKDGAVSAEDLVSGPKMLRDAAIKAVQTWRYQPYLVNGEPVEVETKVTVDFFPPAPPDIQRVGGSVSAPRVLRSAEPVINAEARAKHFRGNVLIYLIVDAEGNPQNISVVKPVGLGLDEAAITAVKQYRFAPAVMDGHPVPVEICVNVAFVVY